VVVAGGGWAFSVRLRDVARQAEKARAVAEQGEQEADRKRQQVNDYLVYLNERLANLKVEQPIRLEFLHEGLALCEQLRKAGSEDAEARRQTALLYRCLGDLEEERGGETKAAEAYGRAEELLARLAADYPAADVYRKDLAVTYSKKAHFLEGAGEHAQALATLRRAIDVQDRLAAGPDASPDYRLRAAGFRVTLGAFLEEQKKPAEAEAAYREALGLAEKLVADPAAPAAVYRQVSTAAGTLAWLLADTRPAEAEALLQRTIRELRAARGGRDDGQDAAWALWGGYTDLAAFFRRHGRAAELAALANQVRGDFLGQPDYTYNAVRFLADAVRVVARDSDLPPPRRDALAEEYAAAAVAMLDKAIKEGYSNRARIEVDPNLDPLRPRTDFAALMTDLERSYPNLSAEQELAALRSLYDTARRNYTYQMDRARTRAERERAQAVKPDLQAYTEKFLELARKRPESATGMEGLVHVLETCQANELGPEADGIRARAAQLLGKDHLQKPEFGTICMRFARNPVPEAEGLLKEAMTRHPHRDVRGLAGLTVAVNLARAGNRERPSAPARAEQLMRQAEQQLEQVLKEYGDVQIGRSSLGQVARHELDEVRYLSVGCPARDIEGEDLHGRRFKLSDFRGKVVVLDFWADWCGFCRQMYPQEQDLVQRFMDRPFALVGVNCDDDRDAIRHTVARKGLGWRSWWDGGPDGGRIRTAWHVTGFPTIWVLDHHQVIRFRGVRGKKLDEAVAKLVKEAEDERAGDKK
jgi:thiol-disulfide isomerase/thioredoxin